MRKVYAGFGDDLDVAALFAEAIMNRTPWQLWNMETGKPAEGAGTLEAIAVLEKAMQSPGGDRHLGLLRSPSGRCGRPMRYATSFPMPATSSTCLPTSTCCAGTIPRWWNGTAGRSRPTPST